MYLACAYMRHKRDLMLWEATKLLNRHRNQADYGIPTTLTDDEIRAVALYAQALRDVPQQSGFPHAVEWPKTPECMRRMVID